MVFSRMWIDTAIILIFLYLPGTPLKLYSLRISLAGELALGTGLMLFSLLSD